MRFRLLQKPPRSRRKTVRRGSVLILVVALLVLMALIGTAFIVTARTDRAAARVHTHNVQADMAAQSAVNLVLAELSADLFNTTGSREFRFAREYRPPADEGGRISNFENWDGYFGDSFLSPRVPVLLDPKASPTSLYPLTPDRTLFPFDPKGVNPPVWLPIGDIPPLPENLYPAWTYDKDRPRGSWMYAPTARPFLGRPLWPCLQVYVDGKPWDSDKSTPEIDPLPAADADGDGIADAHLWKLPMGPMNGLTYYAAVRVVDNNSAVNVNTALARNFDFDGRLRAAVVPSYFTGRVGLAEMLRTYKPAGKSLTTLGEEFLGLNEYRSNSGRRGQPLAAGVVAAGGAYATPYDDRGSARRDFSFISMADALESQLGRRVGNPGNNFGPLKYRPFTLSDSMSLGYRFCLADPAASPSALEGVLEESLFHYTDASGARATVPASPYGADEALRWMDRFRYDLEDPADPAGTFRDLRALLVARNPVANQAPSRYSVTDDNGDGARNDTPQSAVPAPYTLPWREMLLDGKDVRPYDGMQPYFVPQSGADRVRATPPVPVNTATFPELWRGFWSVMAPDYVFYRPEYSLQFESLGVPYLMSPYYGSRFNPPDPANPFKDPATGRTVGFESLGGAQSEHHPHLMFRSSIRDPRTAPDPMGVRFEPRMQMLLRAALAAVNAEDLRDGDDDVTSHLIELRLRPGRPPDVWEEKVAVRVYGTERQPYLTEVYVNTDDRAVAGADGASLANPKGYVAVELYNPYDVPITLGGPTAGDGWSVGLIDRRNDPADQTRSTFALRNLDGSGGAPSFRFPAGTVVPAGGYLVLESYDPVAAATSLAARFRPESAAVGLGRTGTPVGDKVKTVYVPGLHRVLLDPLDGSATGGELVLLRTRRADGRNKVGTPGLDPYNEASNLADLVPVDQFDFTGASLPAPPTAAAPDKVYTALHYVRANGPGAAWRFVYPGRYDGQRLQQRQQGTVQVTFGSAAGQVFATDPKDRYDPPVALGAADPYAHPNQASFPIQLAAPGFGGPNKPRATGNAYPFGLFAREADLLQIPFIGAYTVYAHQPADIPPLESSPPPPSQPPKAGDALYEINSVSMDSVFAEDSDTSDDPIVLRPGETVTGRRVDETDRREQIGRFCPVRVNLPPELRRSPRVDDLLAPMSSNASPHAHPQFDPSSGQGPAYPRQNRYFPKEGSPVDEPRYRYRYRWASDLFEQFTVRAPQNDFLPNVAPSLYHRADGTPITPAPQPVSNSGGPPGNAEALPLDPLGTSNDYAEDAQPVEGLVNVNTAPWKVLAMLPMVLDPATGNVDVVRNEELAKAIVYYRDVDDGYRERLGDKTLYPHGPFRSLFELNMVVDARPKALRRAGFDDMTKTYSFRNGYGTIDFSPAGRDPGLAEGDLSPGVPGETDGVRDDFEEHSLVLNRVSNLITLRSDSFTCYVFVMGVQNDGTPQAEMKVQRRLAFIADRSSVRPLRPVVRTQFFNNE